MSEGIDDSHELIYSQNTKQFSNLATPDQISVQYHARAKLSPKTILGSFSHYAANRRSNLRHRHYSTIRAAWFYQIWLFSWQVSIQVTKVALATRVTQEVWKSSCINSTTCSFLLTRRVIDILPPLQTLQDGILTSWKYKAAACIPYESLSSVCNPSPQLLSSKQHKRQHKRRSAFLRCIR